MDSIQMVLDNQSLVTPKLLHDYHKVSLAKADDLTVSRAADQINLTFAIALRRIGEQQAGHKSSTGSPTSCTEYVRPILPTLGRRSCRSLRGIR